MGKFNYFSYKEKRLEKFSGNELEDLVFDLINAFALVNNPTSAALLVQDLLTEKEVYNLAKRLRIAKLLLAGTKQEDIIKDLHCSFGTVVKVRQWINGAGKGFAHVMSRLPKQREAYRPHKIPGVGYGLPQILYTAASAGLAYKEKAQLTSLISGMHDKSAGDEALRETLTPLYKKSPNKPQIIKKSSSSKPH
ncbi:hypothetical protein HY949_00445 [Candidatus Gottesmanbacteria bacterium]|nr:hypothetical protein [Candidatus Gottesmanbacteria bacterium]